MLDHSWKRWVAENKLLNIPDQEIIDILKRGGIDEQSAREELQTLRDNPYYQAANSYMQLLHKRQSLAMIERALDKLDPGHATIERRRNMSRKEFAAEYYSKNRPVILTDKMRNWTAMKRWTPEYLKEKCGGAMVSISAGRDKNPNYESEDEQHRQSITFADYIDKVENAGETNDFYMTARNDFFLNPDVEALLGDVELFPEFLNPGLPGVNMWYGPKGTYTPLHHDPLNIFMAQVRGRKKIRLVPAAEMDLVYNDNGVYSPVDLRRPDYDQFPKLREATILELELAPGEVLFIPTGWWHDVQALDICITLSLTNFIFPNDFTWVHPMRARTPEQQKSSIPGVSGDWMNWIAENIKRGCDPIEMVSIMEKDGFSIDTIRLAMGTRFPKHYVSPGEASSSKHVINHKAIAEVPAARMEWLSGFRRIDTDRLQLFTLEGFLSDQECDDMVEIINSNLRPSTLTTYVEGFRTSYTSDLAWIKSPLVEAADAKIAMALGIRLPYSEGIQAQKYEVGQEFKAHTDYFEPGTKEYEIHGGARGNRTWTFMIYLNDTPKGGGTRFVNIDTMFLPKRGTAVIWNNLYPTGGINPDTLHWGMLVEEGQKYIITKWFREKGEGPMFYNDATNS